MDGTSTLVVDTGFPAGAYTVTAEAVDADGRSGADTVDFTVVEGEAPTVEFLLPGQGAEPGDCETVEVSVRVTDADATDLRETTLTWSGLPDGAAPPAAPGADGVASFVLDPLPEGARTLQVTATDVHGASGTDTVDITVEPCIEDVCNGLDDDGDGAVDEDAATSTWYEDADGDGHGDPLSSVTRCDAPAGWLADADDCDDTDPEVFPGAPERCNDLDDDCDGEVDEGASGTLYFGMPTLGEVETVPADGGTVTRLVGGLGSVSDLEVDAASGYLWVDTWDAPVVRRIALDGTGTTTMYSGNGAGGQGVGVDPAAGLLFWGEYYGDLWLGAADGSTTATTFLSRSTISTAIGSSLDGIGTGVELDPVEQRVYLFTRSNAGASGRHLLRVGYDGTGLEDLRQIESMCMDLDRVDGWVYFADYLGSTYQMWRMQPDGSGEEYLFDLAGPSACGGVVVDAAAGRIYYLSSGTGDVWSAALDGSDHVNLAGGYVNAQGLDLLPCE